MRLDCRYQQYLRDSMKPDIQICNHNYLLADASHRQEDRPLLLRSYQALVVDEAHKLPDAARQMYTETLSSRDMDELCLLLQQAHYKDFARQLRTTFLTLSFSCTQGFSKLRRKVSEPFVLTPFRRAALIDCIALLQNAGGLPDVPRYLLNRLGEAESLLRLFLLEVPTRILYIDYDADGQPTFCAASNRVPQLLRSALWNTREPAIILRLTTRKNVCYTFRRAQKREWTTAEWQKKSFGWLVPVTVMRWCCSQRTARWRKSAR